MRPSLSSTAAAIAALSTLAASALVARTASAQLDINPPLPNVMLLIDTSGSMENMVDGSRPEAAGAACVPGTPTKLNRWATLASVLTGTIQNFSCHSLNRNSAAFKNEYTWSGAAPYDLGYNLPFHRLLSNGCTPGPGTVGLDTWGLWPDAAIKYHAYTGVSDACSGNGWQQDTDGLLDTFRDRVRLGLMTFDTLPEADSVDGRGLSGTALDPASGMTGTWSYYKDWATGGAPARGTLPNCPERKFEVGARNPAAPPWEGRMLSFGNFDLPLADVIKNNERVQQAILAMRPYGATPLAGMLADAKTFFYEDTTLDPSTGKVFGPATDPFFTGGCREASIIVLSDGEPNLDMRADCAAGKCPFAEPYEIARELATNANPYLRVKTYVVGFGLSSSAGIDCNTLGSTDYGAGGRCDGATGSLKACCTLGRMAFEGGTERAYFADDGISLKISLSTVLGQIAQGSTSRTIPSFATAASAPGGAAAASYQFVSSFDVSPGTALWTGNLERKRYTCENVDGSLVASLQTIDKAKGDDFGANLDASTAETRRAFTAIGKKADGTLLLPPTIQSRRSLRPAANSATIDDGVGSYAPPTAMPVQSVTSFITTVKASPEALDLVIGNLTNLQPAVDCTLKFATTDSSTCAEKLLRWHLGEVNAGLPESRNPAACPSGSRCSKLGSIYHSTPVVVGPPRDFVRDESYAAFAAGAAKTRPTVLYTATTDGQLHAFKVAANATADTAKVDSLENNELWAFYPPATLPRLLGSYGQQAVLLDGAPVVKDVVFERKSADAFTASSTWNTVLVAGGGSGGGYYFALDITDPSAPKFLWQLSTDESGKALFGRSTPTPAIATIQLEDDAGVREVAVAILPGGSAPLKDGECARQDPTPDAMKPLDATLEARSKVRCWGESGLDANVGPARSVSVVRLDTGEVLMTFTGTAGDVVASMKADRTKTALFDSPMTGVPVAYPSQPGLVADRVFVGDADGALWRIDLSSPKPSAWSAVMAWDAYSMEGDTAAYSEPIQTTPIVSVDPIGNTVVLFSTGDQEMFTANSARTRLWSITERPAANGSLPFKMEENWVLPFTDGKRVTGPISLFNGIAYFATFTPNPNGAGSCQEGNGSICGFDYVTPEVKGELAPKPAYSAKDPSDLSKGYLGCKDQPSGTVVFGVAVTQTPTCSNEETVDDPYLGQARTYLSTVTPGDFQLVFQTGKGGTASEGSKTNTVTETLPRPSEATRIDSWASIIE